MRPFVERQIRQRIKTAMETNAGISPHRMDGLLPTFGVTGKLYEAAVLAEICTQLRKHEGVTFRLSEGTTLKFRQKGGGIDKKFPHLDMLKDGITVAEIHLDIYFTTISYDLKGADIPGPPDYHELDIAIVEPGITGYPSYKEIYFAVECKHTTLEKNIIREILGYRRELAYLDHPLVPQFKNWPFSTVAAKPPSIHIFYCSDAEVLTYRTNCKIFGIHLEHFEMD